MKENLWPQKLEGPENSERLEGQSESADIRHGRMLYFAMLKKVKNDWYDCFGSIVNLNGLFLGPWYNLPPNFMKIRPAVFQLSF